MGYHNERICFRLTAKDSARYRALWGKVFDCHTWTDLIRRALEHFYAYHGSPDPVVQKLSDGSLWDFSRRSAPARESEPIRQTTPPVSDMEDPWEDLGDLAATAHAHVSEEVELPRSSKAAKPRARSSPATATRSRTAKPAPTRPRSSTPATTKALSSTPAKKGKVKK